MVRLRYITWAQSTMKDCLLPWQLFRTNTFASPGIVPGFVLCVWLLLCPCVWGLRPSLLSVGCCRDTGRCREVLLPVCRLQYCRMYGAKFIKKCIGKVWKNKWPLKILQAANKSVLGFLKVIFTVIIEPLWCKVAMYCFVFFDQLFNLYKFKVVTGLFHKVYIDLNYSGKKPYNIDFNGQFSCPTQLNFSHLTFCPTPIPITKKKKENSPLHLLEKLE